MRKKTGNLPKRKETVGFQDADEIVKPSDANTKLCVSLQQTNPAVEKNLSAQPSTVSSDDPVAEAEKKSSAQPSSVSSDDPVAAAEKKSSAQPSSVSSDDPVSAAEKNSSAQLSVVSSDDPVAAAEKCLMDSFYEKLIKVHESSGLSYVFNLRERKLDLYMFYKAVTERDGYNQVSKSGKWEEVAELLNLKNHLSLLPSQLQKIYENILYQYEQLYFYRMPMKVCKKEDAGNSVDDGDDEDDGDGLVCSILKRKYSDNASKDNAAERKLATDSCQESARQAPKDSATEPLSGVDSPIHKPTQTSPDDKKTIHESRSPPQPRSAYQIFLKMECDRLRKIHGETPGTLNFRAMALQEWKYLSETDRQPYVEASKKEREIFNKELADSDQPRKKRKYKKRLKQGNSATKDDGYYVTLDADGGNQNSFVPDESFVESTIQVLKNARPSDPIFQTNWDGFSDFPDIRTDAF